jgi:hypothetical protein
MQLHEAIRLGAMMKPQGFGLGSGNPRAAATCALGAAYEAARVTGSWRSLLLVFPQLKHIEQLACPTCDTTQDGLIAHLNDDHRWTREQIADWVEQIERAQEPTSQPVSVENTKSISALALAAVDNVGR